MIRNQSYLPVTLCALLALPVSAEERVFDQPIIDTCTLEGAASWRAHVPPPTEGEQEILDLETQICRMLAAREIDALSDAYLAETGIILLDGAGIADGREAQRALFHAFIDQGYDLAWEPVKASVSASGDMAWAIGAVRVTSPDGQVEHAKYASIWEKQDGKWRNVVEMRNGNGALGRDLFPSGN